MPAIVEKDHRSGAVFVVDIQPHDFVAYLRGEIETNLGEETSCGEASDSVVS